MGNHTQWASRLSKKNWFLCLLPPLLVAGFACAGETQVQVGTLDGVPIYHWQAFKSEVVDDVDRALILREFQRKEFNVPSPLVDERIHDQIIGEYGGDRQKFMRELQAKGATLTNYRIFLREEIILNAMIRQNAKADEQWLAKLRANATVTKLPVKPNISIHPGEYR